MKKKLKIIGFILLMVLVVWVLTYVIQRFSSNNHTGISQPTPPPYIVDEITRPESTFPDVRGLHLDTATSILYTLGVFYEIEYVYNDDYTFMTVIQQSIDPESVIDKTKTCLLTVNVAERIEEIVTKETYPDVTGKKSAEAIQEVINAGYGVLRITSVSDIEKNSKYFNTATPDMVISQEIIDNAYVLTVYVPHFR